MVAKTITAFALGGLVAVGVVVGGAPYYTAHQIRQAVDAGDAAALARHVDFPRVRHGLKTQIGDGLARQLPEHNKGSIWSAAGAALANAAADQVLTALITPDGVMALLKGQLPIALPGAGAAPSAGQAGASTGNSSDEASAPSKASASYVSWDRFEVRVPVGARTVTALLSRQGWLTWRLTQVDLPWLARDARPIANSPAN